MTTTYSLMSGQTVPSNAPGAPAPSTTVIAGTPTRARCTLSLNKRSASYSQATVWGQTGDGTVPYSTQIVPLIVLGINANDGLSVSQDVALDYAYQNVFARLDWIDPSQSVAASVTLAV